MYGLLLENLSEYIKSVYGEDKWDDIRRQAGIDSPSFSVHQVYPENMLNKLAKKAQQVLGVSERDFMDQMGVYFVGFVGQYGYDRVLSVLGRHMRDFLNGLDNLHEYLKFSYPRMRAPSFICENETKQGLTLHYRSKRRGFVYYTMGQIREVARHFYHKEMHIELIREEILFDTVHVTFQLTFDNRAFTLASLAMTREEKHLPISAHVLFEIFPFCIVFGADMVVRSIGNSLMVILPDLLGKKITAWFDLVRPLIAFKFQTILNRTNNIFELVTVEPVTDRISDNTSSQEMVLHEDGSEPEKTLRLKGQMVYMENWRMIMFLGTPVMPDLDSLITTGLYINDLSMHDFSRDLMLAGTQQSVELKLALDQEQQKSKKLEESMRKLDEEMRRTDELLYQMIPKQVADRLRRGENPIDTCEMFDCVSILFSDVVTFTEICSRITPMEVVSMLNAMYSIFDTLTERNNVYKVETIGDAYMVVAGAPEKDSNHAEKVADMALDMIDAIRDLKDPSTGQHLRIRVGVHSGAVVAGIVGLKMPRYCLFGDSVNTASRMESTSEAMRIHVSETTKVFLGGNYKLGERGEIDVKGKGTMKTYWLHEREGRKPISISSFMPLPPVATPAAIIAERRASTIVAPSLKALMPANVCPAAAAGALCSPPPTAVISSDEASGNIAVAVPVTNNSQSNSNSNNTTGTNEDARGRMYSPVTFRDVAQRSIANSPVRSSFSGSEHARASRSNSTGHVFLRSPSDVFGSLILDTEEFLEDLHNSRTSMRRLSPTQQFRIGSAPSKPRLSNPDQFTPEELAAMDQITPPSTAPARETVTTCAAGSSLPSTSSVNSLDQIAMSATSTTTTATIPPPPKPKKITFSPRIVQQPVVPRHQPQLQQPTQLQSQQPTPAMAMTMAMATTTNNSNNSNSNNNTSNSNNSSRATSKESLSMNSPPLPRCHSAPLPMTKAARKALLAAKQTKALEKLDKMIEEASELEMSSAKLHSLRLNHPFGLDNDAGGGGSMGCPLFLPPPPPPPAHSQMVHLSNSMSDTRICNHGHSHEVATMRHHASSNNTVNLSASALCPHTHEVAKLSNSQSFTHPRGVVGTTNHQCCTGFNHSTRHSHHHRMHSNACQLL